MSFLLYLLILSPLPYISPVNNEYEIIRHATIDIPFALNDNISFRLAPVDDCDRCLCEAFRNQPLVILFTCTKHQSMNFSCQFYYFEIKRDEIDYPVIDTDIYLIRQDQQFKEKDDCCNTSFLIEKINDAIIEAYYVNHTLRSLVSGEKGKIATIADGRALKINMPRLGTNLNLPEPSSLSTIGYHENKYYLGKGSNIIVYDERMDKLLGNFNAIDDITTIRFINGTQMLVGTVGKGVRIYKKDVNGIFSDDVTSSAIINGINPIRGIGIVDDSAFYTDSNAIANQLLLYTKSVNKTWINSPDNSINIEMNVSDLVIDNCKRLWAVQAEGDKIFIYDQNRSHRYNITYKKTGLFNLVILEDQNYTLMTSHSVGDQGLHRVKPNLNCRPLYKKKK